MVSSSLVPLSAGKGYRVLRPPVNGGNTCYLDCILVALFAEFDGWDGLLLVDNPSRIVSHICGIVNDLRTGHGVQGASLSKLRELLIKDANWYSGRGQEDAAELFAFLLDVTQAPFVLLVKNINHRGFPDSDADHPPFTERMLWLNLYSSRSNNLTTMIDNYFYAEIVHGLRRQGVSSDIDASVSRSLIPAYSAVRETGETVPASETCFNFVTVPFAISRFSLSGEAKDRSPMTIPMVIPATRYVSPFTNGATYSFILRSVVCHLGSTMRSGHYVTYTYLPTAGWRRWDDLEDGAVPCAKGDVNTGMPEIRSWALEIQTDCYLLFYELVSGEGDMRRYLHLYDGSTRRQVVADAQLAAQQQAEEDRRGAIREQNRLSRTRGTYSPDVPMRSARYGLYESLRSSLSESESSRRSAGLRTEGSLDRPQRTRRTRNDLETGKYVYRSCQPHSVPPTDPFARIRAAASSHSGSQSVSSSRTERHSATREQSTHESSRLSNDEQRGEKLLKFWSTRQHEPEHLRNHYRS